MITPPRFVRTSFRVRSVAIAAMLLAAAPVAAQYSDGTPVALHRRAAQPPRSCAPRDSGARDLALAVPSKTDQWIARDKALHFTASATIEVMAYGYLRLARLHRTPARYGASIITIAAGIGKELWDAHGHGDASGRDLVFDGLGLLAGYGLVRIAGVP